MNKQLLLIILLLFQSLSAFIPTISSDGGDWVIDEDKIFVDDENVYLSCEPHTIIQDTDVVFELISKKFGGEIDVVFGINNTLMKPKNPMLWNGTSWNPLNKQIQVVNYDHLNFTRWYILKNVNINEDVLYRLKLTIDIVFNTSGKYFFGVKRSIDNINQGYYIDPWWGGIGWNWYSRFKIDSSFVAATLRNFPVLVPINATISGLCDGGKSLRFVSVDNNTEYYYEFDNGSWNNNSINYVWVNLTKVYANQDTDFYVYYNNSEASDNQNVQDVWNSHYINVLHLDDLTASTVEDSTWTQNGTKSGQGNPLEITNGKIGEGQNFSSDYIVFTGLTSTTEDYVISFWIYADDDTTAGQYTYSVETGRFTIEYVSAASAGDIAYYDGGYQQFGVTPSQHDWQHLTFSLNHTTGDLTMYVNGTLYGVVKTYVDRNIGDKVYLGDHYEGGHPTNGLYDEFRVMDANRNASWIETSYHTQNQTTNFLTSGAKKAGLAIFAPTNLFINTTGYTSIDVNWTKGTGATNTYIMRKLGSLPSDRTDGTNIYNSTGVSFDDAVSANLVYYYRLWSYNSTVGNWSVNSIYGANHTGPLNPTGILSKSGLGYINFTWTAGIRAENTILVHNANAYPTGPTDGTEICNTTALYYNDTTYYSGFYTMFGYNTTVLLHSSGVHAAYGSLTIAVFDENTSKAITNWDIFITNADGSDTYESLGNNNNLVLDIGLLPQGDNTAIKINASWYDFRVYYMDIEEGNIYILNAHLAEMNITELYLLTVEDEANQPVEGAKMRIMQYINATVGYENVSMQLTDAYGQISVYLIPGKWNSLYKIVISKTGYQTATPDYIPDDVIFTKTFRLLLDEIEFENETTYNEAVTFEGYVGSSGYVYVNYTDSLNETTSTNICIYEHDTTTGNATVFYWDNRTNENDFTFDVLGNTSNCYEVVLSLVHTTFGTVTDSFIICGDERPYINISDQTWADALFEANYGTNPFGWSNFFGFFILLAGVFGFGQRNTGVSLIVTGGILIFINTVIGWTVGGAVIPVLFIILGVLVQWANHRKEATG